MFNPEKIKSIAGKYIWIVGPIVSNKEDPVIYGQYIERPEGGLLSETVNVHIWATRLEGFNPDEALAICNESFHGIRK